MIDLMKSYNPIPKTFEILQPAEISITQARIAPYIHRTSLVTSTLLNNWLGHDIIFKPECFQKIGAFKARGAINKLLTLKEQNRLPNHVVAFSAGNHAQGVAWAAQQFGVKATIFLPEIASSIKKQATRSYGAEVIITKTRQEAEDRTAELAEKGAYLIPPYDDDDIITGQGTAAYEALEDLETKPDAIFAACGGGGLLSGSYLAKTLLSPESKLFGVEPICANDAASSYRERKIYRFEDSPPTIADGVRTLSVSPRTFHYLQQLDGFYEVDEEKIIYWTQWLSHLLKTSLEPTAALAMAGAHTWLKDQKQKQHVLIILSGGNIAPDVQKQIWKKSYLEEIPKLY